MPLYGHHRHRYDLAGFLVPASAAGKVVGCFGFGVTGWILAQHEMVLSPFPAGGNQHKHNQTNVEHRQNRALSILTQPNVFELRCGLPGAVAVGEFDPDGGTDARVHVLDHPMDYPARRILS